MAVGSVLLTILAIAWIYFLWSRRRFYICAWKMRGPWGLPLIGIAYQVLRTEDILKAIEKFAKQYNTKTFFTWMGPYPAVFTLDPVVAERVLQSPDCLNKAAGYVGIRDAVGTGILTSQLLKWIKNRKILTPFVGHKVILGFMENFNKFGQDFCERIDKHVGCGEVDMKMESLKIALKTSFNFSMDSDLEDEQCTKIIHSFEKLVTFMIYRMILRWLSNPTILSWTQSYKNFLKHQEIVVNSISSVLKSRIKFNSEPKLDPDSDGQTRIPLKVLNQMIQSVHRNELTLEDAIDESVLLVLAGFETSGNTLYSTLMFLAMHPEFQQRAYEEISTVFCDPESDLTHESLKNLVYLDMCINEAMRLAPSIPVIGRECAKDFPISKDIVVPAGVEIYIPIFNIQRGEDIWGPTASQYNPDHFLPSNLEGKHRAAFLPFSKGKRNCLGWVYAGVFLKMMLAHALRKYRFSTTFRFEDLRYDDNIFLWFVDTPRLEVHRR